MSVNERFATRLEHLPVEILLHIFAFFPLRQLVPSFFGLNSHIDSVLRSVRGQHHGVRCNDIDAIQFLRSFPAQIDRLVVVNADVVDLTPCMNLRSLTLERGTATQLGSLRPHYFPMLEVLHIKALQAASSDHTKIIDDLFEVILSNGFPRLRVCSAVDIGTVNFSNKWTGSPSLRILNLKMRTIEDDARLRSKLPSIEQLTTYEHSSISLDAGAVPRGYARRQQEFEKLKQLEADNKFILDVSPFERVFDRNKLPPRFNNTRAFQRPPLERVMIIQGRILPQTEPYRRASFLIEIALSLEYPFAPPEVTLLDPVYHPQVTDLGRCCACNFERKCVYSLAGEEHYGPRTSLSNIITATIDVIDSPLGSGKRHNPKRGIEYVNDYSTFLAKALESTLSYGRPRY